MFQDFGGEIAKDKAAGAFGGFGFEHGAVFKEPGEVAGEFVEIIAKEVGAVFFRGGFEHESEVQQMLGERDFVRGIQ